MRRLSLNARLAQDELVSDEVHVVLLQLEHPELEQPIRLSTDNTERISVDPLIYGTRSTWRDTNPIADPFLWVLASALVPSDLDDAPAAATVILENLGSEAVELLRSFTDLATVHMAVVLASSPNLIEAEWSDMRLMSVQFNAGEISLQISREEVELEPYPAMRMTRDRFPGLHR